MAILDKLMEKKDLMAYIEFRIRNLVQARERQADNEDEQARSHAIAKIQGRINELDHLRSLISQNKLRDASIAHFRAVELQQERLVS